MLATVVSQRYCSHKGSAWSGAQHRQHVHLSVSLASTGIEALSAAQS